MQRTDNVDEALLREIEQGRGTQPSLKWSVEDLDDGSMLALVWPAHCGEAAQDGWRVSDLHIGYGPNENAALRAALAAYKLEVTRRTERIAAKTAAGVVQAFSNWVNGMGHDNADFTKAVMQEHRTLQQQMFETMLACIVAWSEQEHCDARNEYTVKLCKTLAPLLPCGARTPFI